MMVSYFFDGLNLLTPPVSRDLFPDEGIKFYTGWSKERNNPYTSTSKKIGDKKKTR